jgi:DNA-binding transcriptional MocR family regulator
MSRFEYASELGPAGQNMNQAEMVRQLSEPILSRKLRPPMRPPRVPVLAQRYGVLGNTVALCTRSLRFAG